MSDDQRSILIDLMSQNENLTIRDASQLLQIKYENAKAIWTAFKKSGRKHNKKESKSDKLARSSNTRTHTAAGALQRFDHASEQLRQTAINFQSQAHVRASLFLKFSAQLLNLEKPQGRKKRKVTKELLFLSKLDDVREKYESKA